MHHELVEPPELEPPELEPPEEPSSPVVDDSSAPVDV
jgi:hypothetical protein